MKIVVDLGACQMVTTVYLKKNDCRNVSLDLLDSECEQIQKLTDFIDIVSFKELFLPISKNPVFQAAERAKLHPSCPVPIAILKGMEAILGLAVPRGVFISLNTE